VQLGRFVNGFDPLLNDPSLWEANWRPFDEANTTNAGFNPAVGYISRSNALNADGTTPVAPFDETAFDFRSPAGDSKNAYMWLFNGKDLTPGTEWALITDPDWTFPETVNPLITLDWRPDDTTTAILGGVNNGEIYDIQTASVGPEDTGPMVPEPSTALLLLAGLVPLVLKHRR
jgi:hypothetical protein